jgi:hypothetical protein
MSSPKKKSTREARLEKIERILEAHEKSMSKNYFYRKGEIHFYHQIFIFHHTHFSSLWDEIVCVRSYEPQYTARECKWCVANLENNVRKKLAEVSV